jgi:uncharacterized protein (DUF2336 family)
MSLDRPSGSDLDGAAQLLASARARISAAAADLERPAALRLTDWQRTTLSAMLERLVGSIEDELRSALLTRLPDAPEALLAALSSAQVPLARPILDRGSALQQPALVSALLRRAEEHRLRRVQGSDQPLLLELSGDADPDVAAAAMAVLIGQTGRRDAFDEPLLPREDLRAELAHDLVWAVAAALRVSLTTRHGLDAGTADAALAALAGDILARSDEGDGFDSKCARLVLALRSAGRLERGLLVRGVGEGHLSLFLAGVAAEASLDVDAVWEIYCAASGAGLPLLLRAAGFSREEAAGALLALQQSEQQLASQLDRIEGIAPAQAAGWTALWRADPVYRSTLAELIA